MEVFKTIESLRDNLINYKRLGRTIGLVPTMGALHEGHLELVKASKASCDITIATIFVNPTQFNNPEDLEKYPRNESRDLDLLEKNGADFVFTPDLNELYPFESTLSLNFGSLEHLMEGKHRPGHFSGVGLVVAKLFNITQPDIAFFGQKDLQQYQVIKKLVSELNIPVELRMIPIIREKDGLAMSSRNQRLSDYQRAVAPALYTALGIAADKVQRNKPIESIKKSIEAYFAEIADIDLEYFEIVEAESLGKVGQINSGDRLALCLACYLGEIRLIDNMLVEVK